MTVFHSLLSGAVLVALVASASVGCSSSPVHDTPEVGGASANSAGSNGSGIHVEGGGLSDGSGGTGASGGGLGDSHAGASAAGAAQITGGSGGAADSSGSSGSGGSISPGGSGNGSSGNAGDGAAGGIGSGVGGAAPTATFKAYLVITSKGTPTVGDLVMIGRIKAHGASQVTPITDAAVTADSVKGADLVVISSSAESGPLKAKLKDIAIPVLVVEDAEFKLMGMAAAGDHDSNISQVKIAPAGAALVGSASGLVSFSSKPGELGWAAGTNADTAVIGATMPGEPTHAVIFGYPKGAQMSGMVAPARRAGFAIRETLAANLNAEGLQLFDSILAWVLQ